MQYLRVSGKLFADCGGGLVPEVEFNVLACVVLGGTLIPVSANYNSA